MLCPRPSGTWELIRFALGLDGTVRGLTVGPPNGIIADLNQDGVVAGDGTGPAATDDVTAFVTGWLTAGAGSIADRYARGDINLNGITDLADWAILNRENSALGSSCDATTCPVFRSRRLVCSLCWLFPK